MQSLLLILGVLFGINGEYARFLLKNGEECDKMKKNAGRKAKGRNA